MRVPSVRLVPLLLLLASASARATVPEGFEETRYRVPGVTGTSLAWAPDGSGRLFLLDKAGRVLVATLRQGELGAAGAALELTTFATESVFTNSECGLLGIAFDPNFTVNRFVYLFVTATASTQRIVRYTDAGGVGTARTVIVDGLPTRGQNHDGGGLGFGLDGKLYWAIGDLGAGVGVNEDLGSLAAKVGRANPDGTPASDNPFADGSGPHNDYVWARGFRNPFTLTFQPGTGRLWVNSVGTRYEQVFAVGPGDHAGYNLYENDQPPGFLTPLVKYRTNGTDTRELAGASRRNGLVTFETRETHGFRKGERIRVAGTADASFEGDLYVASTPAARTWTAAQAGPDASSSGGTATTQALGGSLTGGTFYDATLFPPDYRGNFLFGDFNAGILSRVTLAADDSVATVDAWGTGFEQAVDLAVGPDGALYVLGVGSELLTRVRPSAPPQGLVVSALHVPVPENGQALFSVRLARAPAADVSVSVQRSEGSLDLAVVGGAALTFTSANWSEPQPVTLAAVGDADAEVDVALLRVEAAGLEAQSVRAASIEPGASAADAPPRAVLVRPTPREVVSGANAEFYGDCEDDVGCTRGEFYVDGRLESTDEQGTGHYAFGGARGRWDTRALGAGVHTVRLVVYDTAGQAGFAEAEVCVETCDAPGPGNEGDDIVEGCGCGAAGPGAALAWLGLAGLLRRRRARRLG